MKIYECVVVGSGCSGAMAAQTLVEGGLSVTMLDAGITNPDYDKKIPDKDFASIRRSEPDQHRYFIGDEAEGVVWGDVGKGAQITPPRDHMVRFVDSYLPIRSDSFSPLESLGYGGLGIGWGLQCWEFSETDQRMAGLDPAQMYSAYETVAQRIGISATKDDAARYTLGKLTSFQPSAKMDRNHQLIYRLYKKHQKSFNNRGFYVSRTPLALLTKDRAGRKKYAYRDMDYYSDKDQSAWRPWMTVNMLRKRRNFEYKGGCLLLSFKEHADRTELNCLDIATGRPLKLYCKKLVLATGAIGSGRIVLRSQGKPGQRLPLLCNPYTYVPCLQPRLIGKGLEPKKLGFAQLSLFLDESGSNYDVSIASLYGYQSLMLFRLIRHLPFNFKDARSILSYLMSGLVIMGVHHPDQPSPDKYVELVKNASSPTKDVLHISYKLSDEQKAKQEAREKKFVSVTRRVGVHALKRIDPGHGASIHYAGTLPFSREERRFSLSPEGKLHRTNNVWVADSSGFNYLPARGLTFSLMANSHIVARGILNNAKH